MVSDAVALTHPPEFFTQMGDAEQYGRALLDWASRVDEDDPAMWDQAVALNLVHATMNELDLKPLMEVRGRLIANLLTRKFKSKLDHDFGPRTLGPWRVGIFLNHLDPQPEIRAAAAIAKTLPADFVVRVYSPYDGPMREHLDAAVLGNDCQHALGLVRDDDLDLALIAGNTSMVSSPLLPLAMHRLARTQVASMWSLVTTGLPHSDAYLSASSVDRQDQYTEQLRHMVGAGHCFASLPGDPPLRQRTRPTGKVRYVSASNFFKITPECLDTWAAILREVPDAELMMYPFGASWSNSYPVQVWVNFVSQFFADRGVDPERVMIWNGPLAHMPEGNRLEDGDIYLDSMPVSGATGLIEPCRQGIPVVTARGSTMRSSMGWDMLARSGVLVHVDYTLAAIHLAQDSYLREHVRYETLNMGPGGFGFLNTQAQGRNLGETFNELIAGSF